MKKWEECTSHFTQQTADYGVIIQCNLPSTINSLQFACTKGVRSNVPYIAYAKALYHAYGWQASSSILAGC